MLLSTSATFLITMTFTPHFREMVEPHMWGRDSDSADYREATRSSDFRVTISNIAPI
jgi:hypothetical protein